MQLKIKRLHHDAILPRYATSGAAGLDLHAVGINRDEIILAPGETVTIRTGLAFEVPDGWVMLLFSRSGHGRQGLRLANSVGVIDPDYRGEVQVMLTYAPSGTDDLFRVQPGDRIAQAVLVPAPQFQLVEADELSETARGAGGFGSTGR